MIILFQFSFFLFCGSIALLDLTLLICRGHSFRSIFLRIGEVKSLLHPNVNIMAVTATATTKLRKDVSRNIGLRNELIVEKLPAKTNIAYSIAHFSSFEESLKPVADRLMKEGPQCPRVIIYCRTRDDCSAIFLYLKDFLGVKFTHPLGSPDLPGFRLVDMYMTRNLAL